MRLKTLELNGFKSFSQKSVLEFNTPIVSIVGPNGSGKSNVVEALRYVLGEQSIKSMRGKSGSDLIFKGSKNLSAGSRAAVTIYFDNKDKVFRLTNDVGEEVNLNFDTVSISREVYPDGVNNYILNGTEVRLKDIHNLLASVNIGASGHQIISQGEADRILNSNPKERKAMVEDALGLKVYQYKIKESERKLERTTVNMKEVSMLRRENAPHLNFLRKQVEKFEKAKEMEAELALLYKEYLKRESVYLEKEKAILLSEKKNLMTELDEVSLKLEGIKDENGGASGGRIDELRALEKKINEIRSLKNELERKIGRIEGMLEAKEHRVKISGRCPLCGNEIQEMHAEQIEKRQQEEQELVDLKNSQTSTMAEIARLEQEEIALGKSAEALKEELNKHMEALRDLEREKFSFKVRHQELASALEVINIKEVNLSREFEAFENELREGVALVGREILAYRDHVVEGEIDLTAKEDQKRKIERIKIKLEDAGLGGGAEVLKEFKEATERDEFLAKELEDLNKSIESLQKLIVDLKEKIDVEFKEGIRKINIEFNEFFKLVFGGGHGNLSIISENKRVRKDEAELLDEETSPDGSTSEFVFEQGVDISVSLPQKKVKELQALSGGERSLTSIALLFAMSQVNPPPFLVLDETDAALDEANSRKYGDMLEKLSKHSQLIVVTHNRETMSRAGVLYGVTIGADGASKLLSVKLDEAAAIAK